MGWFCQKKYWNHRSQMTFQLSIVKNTIMNHSRDFERYINLYFNKFSNKIILIIEIIKMYIEFLDEKKKNHFFF